MHVLNRYFIYGGLVFVPLSEPLLEDTFGLDWPTQLPSSIFAQYSERQVQKPGEEVVILKTILKSSPDITVGYSAEFEIVKSVNGIDVLNVAHLSTIIDTCQDKIVKIRLASERFVLSVHMR